MTGPGELRPSGFGALPPTAAWRHRDARSGFEVVFLTSTAEGVHCAGHTAAIEDGVSWSVEYRLRLDAGWHTRSAHVSSRTVDGVRSTHLESDGAGTWTVDGRAAPHLDGCLDVDLEASALTNAFPVHRLGLRLGDTASAPAAYVRAEDVTVQRLDQSYRRLANSVVGQRFSYHAPAFDFSCELQYDEAGLVVDYPGIAARAG